MSLWIKIILGSRLGLKRAVLLLDKQVERMASFSFYNTSPCGEVIEDILSLSEQKVRLLELDQLFVWLVKQCTSTERIVLPCIAGVCSRQKLADTVGVTKSKVSRLVDKVTLKLTKALAQNGHTDGRLYQYFGGIDYVKDLEKRAILHSKREYGTQSLCEGAEDIDISLSSGESKQTRTMRRTLSGTKKYVAPNGRVPISQRIQQSKESVIKNTKRTEQECDTQAKDENGGQVTSQGGDNDFVTEQPAHTMRSVWH
ncbi:MAG: hypothetical protein FWD76_04975 [Firmicutes bacterium]|nr:hypothetical protein [Bacillota bacterium]